MFYKLGNNLFDLQGDTREAFEYEASQWVTSSLITLDIKTSLSENTYLLGGYNILSNSDREYFQRIYTDLPPHNIISFSIEFWAMGAWNPEYQDTFNLALDSIALNGWDLEQNSDWENRCDLSHKDLSFTIQGKIAHNRTGLDFRVIAKLSGPHKDKGFAFRDIHFHFLSTTDEIPNQICTTSAFIPQRLCKCNLNDYESPVGSGQCFSLNTNEISIENLENKEPNALVYSRLLSGIICDDSCLTCSGTTANDCLSCPSGFELTQIGSTVNYCAPESYHNIDNFIVYGVLTPPETPGMPTLLVLSITMEYVKYLQIKLPANLERLQMSQGRNILSLRYGMHMQSAIQAGFTYVSIPEIYARQGLHSSFLVNFWQEIISLAIIAVAAILFTILELLARKFKSKNLEAIFTPCRMVTRYNFLFLLTATSIGDIILYSTLEFITLSNSSQYALKYISYALSLIWILIIIGVLIAAVVMPYQLKKARETNMTDYVNFFKNWPGCRVLYSSFNLNRLISRSFFMVYTLRLGLPMIIACAFTFSALSQAILQLLVSIAIVILILYFRPMRRTVNQVQIALIEGIVLILNVFLLILTIYDVYDVGSDDSAWVFGYIVLVGNFIIMVLIFIFLFIKLGLEIKTIISLRKHQTTPEKISAWIQLLYIIIQQGAMGFESVFEGASTEATPNQIPVRTITQIQPSTLAGLNEKPQGSLATLEMMTQREPKAEMTYPNTHPTVMPTIHELGKLPQKEKMTTDSVIKDQSYNGSFLMEDSHRELLPQFGSEAKLQQQNRVVPGSLPHINTGVKPQQQTKPVQSQTDLKKSSKTPTIPVSGKGSPTQSPYLKPVRKPNNSKPVKDTSIHLNESMGHDSPALSQKVSPALKPKSNRGAASILMDNSEYAISYENWLDKIRSKEKIQYDPTMNQMNNNNKQTKNGPRGSNHLRHNSVPKGSLNDYFQKMFNNQGGPKGYNGNF